MTTQDLLQECCKRLDRKEFTCTDIERTHAGQCFCSFEIDLTYLIELVSSSFEKSGVLQMWFECLQATSLSISNIDEGEWDLTGGHA